MNRAMGAVVVVVAAVAIGLFAGGRSEADRAPAEGPQVAVPAQVSAPVEAPAEAPVCEVVELAKKCSTSADCPNSKCKSGKCGGCSTSSDCKYGKCKSGQCGGCSTSSDCGGWGKCKSGRCGGCSTSSDCGDFGSCRSGHCEKTPY